CGFEEMREPDKYPIRGIFFTCCASANVPMARRRSVTIQRSLLFIAFTLPAQRLCHKTEPLRITTLWTKTAKGTSHSCYRSSRFDSVRGALFALLLLRTTERV